MNYECNGYKITTETPTDREAVFKAYAEAVLGKEKTKNKKTHEEENNEL